MNPFKAELDETRRRLRDAEEELAEWRRTAKAFDATDSEAGDRRERLEHVRRELGLQNFVAAKFVLALYDAARPVSYETLDELIPSPMDASRIVAPYFGTLACYARRALGKNAVATHHGWGYSLTPMGRDKVKAILSEME